MEITLSRVVEAARQRRAALTAEAGGYIVLRVLQRLAACPRQVTADHVGLTAAGEVELAPSAPGEAREVERELRGLLGSLLALSQSAPPALRATSERASVGDLAALEAELAAALIPINPAAQGRALARLFRETHKALDGGTLVPSEPQSASLPSVKQPSSEATPLSSRVSAARALPTPTPPSAVLAMPAPRSVTASPTPVPRSVSAELTPLVPALSVLLTPLTPLVPAALPSRTAARVELPELAEFAIDVEIELSEDAAADDGGASEIEDLDDVEVLLVEDELDELLAAPVAAPVLVTVVAPIAVEGRAVAPVAAVVPLAVEDVAVEPALAIAAVAADAAASALTEPVSAPPAVSELAASSPLPRAEPRPEVLTPLPASSEDPELFESPLPDSSPFAAYGEPEPPPQRSDLRELLAGYLAHTRCEEHMTADLRRMIGLDPWRAPGAVVNRPELGR